MSRGSLLKISGLLLLLVILGLLWLNSKPRFWEPQVSLAISPSAMNTVQMPSWTPFQPLTNTPTLTSSPTVTFTARPSSSPITQPTFTPSATPTPTVTPTPLDEANIEGIKGRWAAYNLDCEARSAVDWAGYFGVPINEIEFLNALPRSDDPNRGFVGEVNAPWGSIPPQSYGVHAKPIAKLLREYSLDAKAVSNFTWDQLRAEISQGRPVIAWVVGRVGNGTPIPYTTNAGQVTTVARFEHTVIVTGYTKTEVTVLDGYWVYNRGVQDFLASWSVLENMVVIMDPNW